MNMCSGIWILVEYSVRHNLSFLRRKGLMEIVHTLSQSSDTMINNICFEDSLHILVTIINLSEFRPQANLNYGGRIREETTVWNTWDITDQRYSLWHLSASNMVHGMQWAQTEASASLVLGMWYSRLTDYGSIVWHSFTTPNSNTYILKDQMLPSNSSFIQQIFIVNVER